MDGNQNWGAHLSAPVIPGIYLDCRMSGSRRFRFFLFKGTHDQVQDAAQWG